MTYRISRQTARMLLATVGGLAFATSAQAALNVPVPVNATVAHNGYQWAWASPLGSAGFVDLSFQGTLGWRAPTAAELLLAPTALQFIYAGANTPFGGTDPVSGANWQFTDGQQGFGALATPYFSSTFSHGDFCNGQGSACRFGQNVWNGGGITEFLVIRGSGAVPEPATWTMMLLGFMTIGGALRATRQTRAVTVSYA